eukprot:3729053-Rhodomonas_salina.2
MTSRTTTYVRAAQTPEFVLSPSAPSLTPPLVQQDIKGVLGEGGFATVRQARHKYASSPLAALPSRFFPVLPSLSSLLLHTEQGRSCHFSSLPFLSCLELLQENGKESGDQDHRLVQDSSRQVGYAP